MALLLSGISINSQSLLGVSPILKGITISAREKLGVAPILKGITITQNTPYPQLGAAPILKGITISSESILGAAPILKGITVSFLAVPPDNLTIKVQEKDMTPIEDATVTLEATGYARSRSTDVDGITTAGAIPTIPNTLTVSKPGFQTYRHIFTPLHDESFEWLQTMNRIVPVMPTKRGPTTTDINPVEPNNNTFD